MSVQVIQILQAGVQGSSSAQLQAGGVTYSASQTSVGLSGNSALAVGQDSASVPAYWATADGYIFTSASNTTGLQAVNGQQYCVQNTTTIPIYFVMGIGNNPVSTPTPIPPGQALSFTYNSAATASSLIPVAVASNCTSPAVPVPTSSKLKAWIEAHKTYAILIGIAAAIVIILILAGIGKLLS